MYSGSMNNLNSLREADAESPEFTNSLVDSLQSIIGQCGSALRHGGTVQLEADTSQFPNVVTSPEGLRELWGVLTVGNGDGGRVDTTTNTSYPLVAGASMVIKGVSVFTGNPDINNYYAVVIPPPFKAWFGTLVTQEIEIYEDDGTITTDVQGKVKVDSADTLDYLGDQMADHVDAVRLSGYEDTEDLTLRTESIRDSGSGNAIRVFLDANGTTEMGQTYESEGTLFLGIKDGKWTWIKGEICT